MALGTNPLVDLLEARAKAWAEGIALSLANRRDRVELTYADLFARTRQLAGTLAEAGLEPGDRVAILADSGPAWGVAFLGSLRAGAIVVPLDPKLTEAELESILDDCRPRVLFVSPSEIARAATLRALAPSIEHVLTIDDALVPNEAAGVDLARVRIAEDPALIVYVSATTGRPKGVVTTYANLLFEIEAIAAAIDAEPGDVLLSVLPLNHLLELTCGFLAPLLVGATVTYAETLFPHQLAELMRERRVSAMIGVPLLFRSLKAWLERKSGGDRRLLGDALRLFVSGGAPLDPEVATFFERLGVPVLQGYGLTETSPVISTNTLTANRIGSVGRPLPGVEVEIAPDGEILTRGPHVMRGYYRRADLTREAIDAEGWFHTGDVGHVDADGYLHVTGRLKSLIVLGNGKKVDPDEVEVCLSRASTIRDVSVFGWRADPDAPRDREAVCAIVVPADLRRWRCFPAAVSAEIRAEIGRLTQSIAPYKRPTTIFIRATARDERISA